mmetsp:Transcript_45025/g.104158  ORF Transcript_45025/g.104158 Transcript_45025/m.104158 type:complete len:331 (+) Transcript_45025:170-1162(+)
MPRASTTPLPQASGTLVLSHVSSLVRRPAQASCKANRRPCHILLRSRPRVDANRAHPHALQHCASCTGCNGRSVAATAHMVPAPQQHCSPWQSSWALAFLQWSLPLAFPWAAYEGSPPSPPFVPASPSPLSPQAPAPALFAPPSLSIRSALHHAVATVAGSAAAWAALLVAAPSASSCALTSAPAPTAECFASPKCRSCPSSPTFPASGGRTAEAHLLPEQLLQSFHPPRADEPQLHQPQELESTSLLRLHELVSLSAERDPLWFVGRPLPHLRWLRLLASLPLPPLQPQAPLQQAQLQLQWPPVARAPRAASLRWPLLPQGIVEGASPS